MPSPHSASPIARDFPAGVAVVFGGSGGIGRAICERLAVSGCPIVFSYHANTAAAAAMEEQLRGSGCEVDALRVDLSDRSSVAVALQYAQQAHGRIHTVVLATGTAISMARVSTVDPDEWRRVIDSDLHGAFHVVQCALPLLRAGGGGSLVAVTSAGLDRHPPLDILSVAPKAGVEALMRGIAREEGRHHIRANSVAPGMLDGGLFHHLQPQLTADFMEAVKRNTALRRLGTVQEVAEVVAFLASSRASYVTGQHIAVDGGYSV